MTNNIPYKLWLMFWNMLFGKISPTARGAVSALLIAWAFIQTAGSQYLAGKIKFNVGDLHIASGLGGVFLPIIATVVACAVLRPKK